MPLNHQSLQHSNTETGHTLPLVPPRSRGGSARTRVAVVKIFKSSPSSFQLQPGNRGERLKLYPLGNYKKPCQVGKRFPYLYFSTGFCIPK